jgi:hypothetical protein
MAIQPSTAVPLNTMLADLDESLRSLLRRELGRHGFDGVEIAFEAPDKEWAASLSSPAVSLFLYDLREAKDVRPTDWDPLPDNGGPRRELRPPLRVDASYAVTAWTRDVEDEHRLLSQVMAILYAFPLLPEDVLAGTLVNGSQRFPLRTRTAAERHEDASDFWSAVGGQYKVSINYVVTLACEAGTSLERGPEVRTQTVRVYQRDGGRATIEESHRLGGVVRDAEGSPVANAWVALPARGAWSVTGSDGRFRFERLDTGTHHLLVRAPDGAEAELDVAVPGAGSDVVLGQTRGRARRPS